LKFNPNYNRILNFGDMIKKTKEMLSSFHRLGGTYRKALRQMSTTLSKSHEHFLCPEVLLQVFDSFGTSLSGCVFMIHDELFMNSNRDFDAK
jgi:hypothetical protein